MQKFFRFTLIFLFFCVNAYASFTPDAGSMPVSGAANWPHSATPSFSSGVQFQTVRNIRTTATSPRLLYINSTANSMTFQASVRKGYNGTIESVLVGGNDTITIPAYSSALSDVLSFNVTAGDFIYDRSFFSLSSAQTFPSGIIYGTYNPQSRTVTGSVSGYSLWAGYVSTTTSRLFETGTTFEHDIPLVANSNFIFGEYAVVGIPTDSSTRFLTLIGDSKTAYSSPDYSSGSGRQWGQYGMGMTTGAPFQDIAIGGDTLSGFMSSTLFNPLRRELLVFGGDVISHYGTNSVGNALVPSTAATTELALVSQLKGLLSAGQRLYYITLDSIATKTAPSSWATITEGDQSGGGNNSNGVATSVYLNNILKTNKPSYIDGVIDLAAITMTSNGYWKANMTGDGIHQNNTANTLQGAAFAAVWPAPNVSQTISAISATPTSTNADLSWTTGRASSTLINYGLTTSYGNSTSETDTSSRLLSHSTSLSGLQACTKYHYQVDGYDGYFSRGTSSDQSFITSGCTASAAVLSSSTSTNITTAAGGTINFGSAQIVVPTSFTGAASSAVFQGKELDPTAFYGTVSNPSGKYRAGSYVLNLKALTSLSANITTFTNPITVTLPYADGDVTTISVPSLKIQRYDDGVGWTELDSCSVNTVAKTVTCTTTHFSDFALFGDPGDAIPPTITSVSSDKANGSYKAGEVIDIDVTFSEAVTSTGNVTVTLETGTTDRTCTFTVTSGTTGTCNYTVQAGDTTSDLTVASISGTIADGVGNAMTNFVPATNLAANKAIVIDTTAPIIATDTPVLTPTNDNTPNYIFTTTEAGTVTYGGSCSSVTTLASLGTNTITFNTLTDATYTNCTIKVTDAVGNESNTITLASFRIDTVAPAAVTVNSPSDHAAIIGITSTANGTCETGTTVSITSTHLEINPTTATCTSSLFSASLSWKASANNVSQTLSFKQTDAAGNVSDTVTRVVDSTSVSSGGGGGSSGGGGGSTVVITTTPGVEIVVVPIPNAPTTTPETPNPETTSPETAPLFEPNLITSASFSYLSEDPTILSKLQAVYGAEIITETVYKNKCETNEGKPYYRQCEIGLHLDTFNLFRDDALCEGFIVQQASEKEYRFADTAPRKEVTAIAVKMKKVDGSTVSLVEQGEYRNTYTDIGIGEASWIQPVAETALKYGITTGTRTTFEPDRNVTRAEAYAMMMNSVCMLAKNNEENGKTWQENLYERANTEGLTTKSWVTFEPERPILRQELFLLASKTSDWAERTGGCEAKPNYCFMP